MKRWRERHAQLQWLLMVASTNAVLLALTDDVSAQALAQGDRVPNVQAPNVQVQRYKFYDACFYASVDSKVETATDIRVKLTIEHKQSSGQCGCKSAGLKVLVFADADVSGPPNTPLGGKRLVATTPMFSNSLAQYALTIQKRRNEPPQHYKLWLSCAN